MSSSGLYLWEKEPGSEDAARQLHESVREHLALVKHKNHSMDTKSERVIFPGDSLGEVTHPFCKLPKAFFPIDVSEDYSKARILYCLNWNGALSRSLRLMLLLWRSQTCISTTLGYQMLSGHFHSLNRRWHHLQQQLHRWRPQLLLACGHNRQQG